MKCTRCQNEIESSGLCPECETALLEETRSVYSQAENRISRRKLYLILAIAPIVVFSEVLVALYHRVPVRPILNVTALIGLGFGILGLLIWAIGPTSHEVEELNSVRWTRDSERMSQDDGLCMAAASFTTAILAFIGGLLFL